MLSYTHNKLIFLVTKVISMILENKWRKFMFIQNITCEFVKEPISIDCQHPRFSWEIDAMSFRQPGKLLLRMKRT